MRSNTHKMSYEEKLKQLNELQNSLEELERKIENHKGKILQEKADIERERVEKSEKLSEEEEKDLRNQLTAIVELLGRKNTWFAKFQILDEEPNTESETGYVHKMIIGKYSFDMEISLIEEHGGPGFRIRVTMKTKLPSVVAIVREMIDIEGPREPDIDYITQTYWSADWDYHQRFILKNKN